MADLVTDAVLKQKVFERLRAVKTQIVVVDEPSQFRRDVEVDARVVERQARVDEIGLPLNFARAQAGDQTVRLDQRDGGLRQPDALRVPETEWSAGEIRSFQNRIEAAPRAVRRFRIARGVEARQTIPNPVEIG